MSDISTLAAAIKAAIDSGIGTVSGTFDTGRSDIATAIASAIDGHWMYAPGNVTAGVVSGQVIYGQSDGSFAVRTLVAGTNVTITEAGTNLTIDVAGGGIGGGGSTAWSAITGTPTTLAGYGIASPLTAAQGGTAFSSYTAGDTLYASGATALTKVGIGAANTIYTSSGSAPQWSANIVYGVLPTGSGSWDTGVATTLTVTRGLSVSGALTAAGGLTVSSGQTVVLTGTTITGTPTWSSNQAITVSTAAQPNITSLGTLTALTVSGTVSHTNASPFSMTNGQVVTVALTAQTVGTATLTLPNFAHVNDTFAFITLAQTMSNKTLASATLSGTVAGTPTVASAWTWTSSQALTLSTAAQPNITSVGALTALTVSGTAAFTNTSPFSVGNGHTLTAAVTVQTVGGATLTIPNFASVADTFAFVTLAQTFTNKTLSGIVLSGTVTGTPTWASNQAITLSTPAQPNVTSVGTLTNLTVAAGENVSMGNITVGGQAQQSIVSTGANIFTPVSGTYFLIISGKDAADGSAPSNAFCDTVIVTAQVALVPINVNDSTTIGAPGARTYSNNSGALKLAVATGSTWRIDLYVIKLAS